MQKEKQEGKITDAPPPILGSWNRLYWLVLILHILLITVFYIFTKAYS